MASEADGFQAAFAPFEERTGITVEYAGSRDFDTQISVALESGQTPDIAKIPQPGKILGAADKIPACPTTWRRPSRRTGTHWTELVTDADGKSSACRPRPTSRASSGTARRRSRRTATTCPTTWDEFIALQDKMMADGKTPWCIGIESGDATGWPFTDWIEDFMLRMHGPDVYDQWVNHEIPFNDPEVKEVVEDVGDIWFKDGNVLGGRASHRVDRASPTPACPLLDGDVRLHRQGNFYAANFGRTPASTIGADGDVDVFYLPTDERRVRHVTLGGGIYAVAVQRPARDAWP